MQKVFFIFPLFLYFLFLKSCLFINLKSRNSLIIAIKMVIAIFIDNKAWVK